MRWRDLRRSSNVEDERGGGGRRIGVGGGGIGLLVLAVIVYFVGGPDAVGMRLQDGYEPSHPGKPIAFRGVRPTLVVQGHLSGG